MSVIKLDNYLNSFFKLKLEDADKEDEAFNMEQMVDWLRSGKPLPTSEEQVIKALGI